MNENPNKALILQMKVSDCIFCTEISIRTEYFVLGHPYGLNICRTGISLWTEYFVLYYFYRLNIVSWHIPPDEYAVPVQVLECPYGLIVLYCHIYTD